MLEDGLAKLDRADRMGCPSVIRVTPLVANLTVRSGSFPLVRPIRLRFLPGVRRATLGLGNLG